MNEERKANLPVPVPSGRGGSAPSLWQRIRSWFAFDGVFGRDDLRQVLQEATTNAGSTEIFSPGERSLIQNVLNLSQVRIDDLMVPRANIEAVEANESIAHLVARFRSAEHSRLPVFEVNLDRIIGMIHIKDLLRSIAEPSSPKTKTGLPVKLKSTALKGKIIESDLIRKVVHVPPSMPAGDLLQQMQATRIHMAIVVDEYGGTDGLITIEDLLEAVVGDIEDEHDDAEAELIRQVGDGIYIADGRIELDELKAVIGEDFDPGPHAEEVDTLAGLIFQVCGRIPVRGEVVSRLRGFEFEVVAADARRIKSVKVTRRRRADRAKPLPGATPASAPQSPPGKEAAE